MYIDVNLCLLHHIIFSYLLQSDIVRLYIWLAKLERACTPRWPTLGSALDRPACIAVVLHCPNPRGSKMAACSFQCSRSHRAYNEKHFWIQGYFRIMRPIEHVHFPSCLFNSDDTSGHISQSEQADSQQHVQRRDVTLGIKYISVLLEFIRPSL